MFWQQAADALFTACCTFAALSLTVAGVQDVIDLRHNGWVERRQVEGPKTISEIHRDAAQEAMRKAAGPDRGFGGGRDRGGFRDRGPPPPM